MINIESIKGKIRNLAEENNLSTQEILQMYFFERLLERLSKSEYKTNFVIKGGLLISSLIGVENRTTMDMDTTVKGMPLEEGLIKIIWSDPTKLSKRGFRFIINLNTKNHYHNDNREVTMKSIVYVGMDVHKNTYSLCAVDGKTGEILGETKISSEVKLIKKFISRIKRKIECDDTEFITGYEAGCLGYSLYHQLNEQGIECVILAPTTMHRSSKDKVVKNDRVDSKTIAINLSNGTYKAVYVPEDRDVEVKEYTRMMDDFKAELKKVKQHINAFLLRHGITYSGKSRWTQIHIKWLKEIELSKLYREILDEYLSEYESLSEKIERYAHKLELLSQEERYKEKVGELRAFKGIDTASAMTLHIETADFVRFPTANAYASYCGLVPGESSSGDKSNRTSITKQGNATIRSTLIECAQSLTKGTVGLKSKRVKSRQKGLSVNVIDYADKAVVRLQKKFHKMIYRGVPRNKAITAIARELACFVWGMETGNI